MDTVPLSDRLHIGIFGRCNSGKSSLLNALAGQRFAVVSDRAGTTTDPVNKPMELPGLGAVVLSDTAGFDDNGPLGTERMLRTRRIALRADLAVLVCTAEAGPLEAGWVERFRQQGTPVVAVLNKCDLLGDPRQAAEGIGQRIGIRPLVVSASTGCGIGDLIRALAAARGRREDGSLTGDLVSAGDTVLLVMPQDSGAPQGRLILPQAQTLRELLDKGCTAVSCTPEGMERALKSLAAPPRLVITDSQAFAAVNALMPERSMLTSFSVLYAGYKGDIDRFVAGAAVLTRLDGHARVLIAEACTHAPAGEDIGRVKLPRLLRERAGEGLGIDIVSGDDFPEDLTPYDLVIHCGGCMFNRRHVLSRIGRAVGQGVPITNYGIALAALTGTLDRLVYPGKNRR